MSNAATGSEQSVPEVKIYTDGGCRPNPGPGGYGVVLLHPKKRLEVSGGFRETTNNRMEIYAAIAGLELLKTRCKVTLYSDSQYLVQAMSLGWAVNWRKRGGRKADKQKAKNYDLWLRLLELCEKHDVTFSWVRGHAGTKENERCDALCGSALAKGKLLVDEGYEKDPNSEPEEIVPVTKAGQSCSKCNARVVQQRSRKEVDGELFMEEALICPKCGLVFKTEKVKLLSPQTPLLFRDIL